MARPFVPPPPHVEQRYPAIIWLRSDDDKIMQPIDITETYAYAMNKYLVCKKNELNVTI